MIILSPNLPLSHSTSFSLSARSFSVGYVASYSYNRNVDVECSTKIPESEAIVAIYYTINGGARQTGEPLLHSITFIGIVAEPVENMNERKFVRLFHFASFQIFNHRKIEFKEIMIIMSFSLTAGSTAGFQVDKTLLTRKVNTIAVTLVSSSGLTEDLVFSIGR